LTILEIDMATVQLGSISSKAYPDRTVGYDGYVVLPEPHGPCVVDDKHRVSWESKQAVVRLMSRADRSQHVATLYCARGGEAEQRSAEIMLKTEAGTGAKPDWLVTLVARNNGSFAVMLEGASIKPRARM
jgi:hypothetical protein